jgi:outer membrane autotransporter protein
MIGYARNDVETQRVIDFGGLGLVAKGSYDADQFMMRVGGGVPLNMGSNSFVTPNASFQWTRVMNEKYTETGAGVLNQTVTPEDIDVGMLTAGLRLHKIIKTNDKFSWVPELRASVLYDVAGDDPTSTSNFAGGATLQTAGATTAQLGGAIGVGVTLLDTGSNMTISANYDADFKSDYLGHSGQLQAAWKF